MIRESKILEVMTDINKGIQMGFAAFASDLGEVRKELAPIQPDELTQIIDDAVTTEDEVYEKPGIDKWKIEEYRIGFRKGLEDFMLHHNKDFLEPLSGGKTLSDVFGAIEEIELDQVEEEKEEFGWKKAIGAAILGIVAGLALFRNKIDGAKVAVGTLGIAAVSAAGLWAAIKVSTAVAGAAAKAAAAAAGAASKVAAAAATIGTGLAAAAPLAGLAAGTIAAQDAMSTVEDPEKWNEFREGVKEGRIGANPMLWTMLGNAREQNEQERLVEEEGYDQEALEIRRQGQGPERIKQSYAQRLVDRIEEGSSFTAAESVAVKEHFGLDIPDELIRDTDEYKERVDRVATERQERESTARQKAEEREIQLQTDDPARLEAIEQHQGAINAFTEQVADIDEKIERFTKIKETRNLTRQEEGQLTGLTTQKETFQNLIRQQQGEIDRLEKLNQTDEALEDLTGAIEEYTNRIDGLASEENIPTIHLAPIIVTPRDNSQDVEILSTVRSLFDAAVRQREEEGLPPPAGVDPMPSAFDELSFPQREQRDAIVDTATDRIEKPEFGVQGAGNNVTMPTVVTNNINAGTTTHISHPLSSRNDSDSLRIYNGKQRYSW